MTSIKRILLKTRNKSLFPVLIAVPLLLTGCDFFRGLAGRPTSDEIEAKRQIIQRDEAAHKARLDSLYMVKAQVADSLAIIDSLKARGLAVVEKGQINRLAGAPLKHKCYVILGSFSKPENAARCEKTISAKGYKVEIIRYRNGFTAVGCCPSDRISDTFASLKKLEKEPFFPKDAWILVMN